jgi:hypothetical protein
MSDIDFGQLLASEERRIGRELIREIQCLHPSTHRADCRICQLRDEWNDRHVSDLAT